MQVWCAPSFKHCVSLSRWYTTFERVAQRSSLDLKQARPHLLSPSSTHSVVLEYCCSKGGRSDSGMSYAESHRGGMQCLKCMSDHRPVSAALNQDWPEMNLEIPWPSFSGWDELAQIYEQLADPSRKPFRRRRPPRARQCCSHRTWLCSAHPHHSLGFGSGYGSSSWQPSLRQLSLARFQTPSSESFYCAHRVPGRELSEFLSAYHFFRESELTEFLQYSPRLPQNSLSSLFRNSTLETVFRPFPSMGFLVSQHGQLGAIPPSPFLERFPLREHAKWRRPPTQKGYLSDTCAIPHENKAKRVRYPPLRYYLEKVLRDMGGYLALGRKMTPN